MAVTHTHTHTQTINKNGGHIFRSTKREKTDTANTKNAAGYVHKLRKKWKEREIKTMDEQTVFVSSTRTQTSLYT